MSHLTQEQRYTISVMFAKKHSQKAIAEAIGKHKSVVSRELRRNADQTSGAYHAALAGQKYLLRRKNKPQKIRFTPEIQASVDALLSMDYSPQQVCGRLKREGKPTVSHERIYQYVWAQKKDGGTLHEHLRRKGRKYRKRGAAKDSRGILKDRVGIELRPTIVDQKCRLGDLEIDTIIGKNHKGAILTINDRLSSKVWMGLLKGKDAQELAQMAIKLLAPYSTIIQTITADNGKEFAQHKLIAKRLEASFYFARPYHSWERGANENTNGLIRQYFPKGASFDEITQEDVRKVQNSLNNRPRKKLNFLTPNEFFFQNLTKSKVAFAG